MSIRGSQWVAYAAAAWALIFAVFHIIWACGWYVGLNAAEAAIAFKRPITLPYDLVVAGMCLVGAVVALAPVRPWGARLPRRPVRLIAWIGTVLVALRAVASVIQTAYLLIVGRLTGIGAWEYWFFLGATLYVITTWRCWRSSRAETEQVLPHADG